MDTEYYNYHVSYNFTGIKGQGFGSAEVTIDRPIKTFKDLNNVKEYLINKHNFENLVIISFQQLG